MYQYVWFNKNNYKSHSEKIKSNDLDFIQPKDIENIRISYWGEHCLECAAPQCYGNCTHWVERYDQRCQKFFYGIYDNPDFKEYPFSSEITFRKWGKLETHIYPGIVEVDTALSLDKANKYLSNFVLIFSKILKPIIPNCKLSRGVEFIKSRFSKNYKKENDLDTDTFLFQAYSYDEKEYSLLFDIFTEEKVVYFREKITIKPGFNQVIMDLSRHIDLNTFKGLVRIYPENDYEANIVILFSEFIKLKNKEKYIKGNISEKPAEKVKCVIWDLDNTIWDGILIESDPKSLMLRENVLQTIIDLDNKGIIQAIASKNNESDVFPVLERLGIDKYFVYKLINWSPKSSNIEQLSKLLNINIDTFAFIDDSIYERNEVLSKLPCVRLYNENEIANLLTLPEFDVEVTQDSKKRREMYQTEIKRKNIKINYAGSNIEFLKQCEIKIDISTPDDEKTITRSYELVQRTNQLNLSGNKYSKEDFFEKIKNEKETSFIVNCKDKFGVYGQVGYFTIEFIGNDLCVTEFAMSCRVAGKYVESALINWLIEHFKDNNFESIVFKGVNNSKNKLLIDTLTNIGMKDESTDKDNLLLKISCSYKPSNYDIVKVNS